MVISPDKITELMNDSLSKFINTMSTGNELIMRGADPVNGGIKFENNFIKIVLKLPIDLQTKSYDKSDEDKLYNALKYATQASEYATVFEYGASIVTETKGQRSNESALEVATAITKFIVNYVSALCSYLGNKEIKGTTSISLQAQGYLGNAAALLNSPDEPKGRVVKSNTLSKNNKEDIFGSDKFNEYLSMQRASDAIEYALSQVFDSVEVTYDVLYYLGENFKHNFERLGGLPREIVRAAVLYMFSVIFSKGILNSEDVTFATYDALATEFMKFICYETK